MSDLVSMAIFELGQETNWEVDVAESKDGRLLILNSDGKAVGEILRPSGGRVTFPEPIDVEGLI